MWARPAHASSVSDRRARTAFVVPRPIIFINRDNSCLFRGLVRNRYRRAVLQAVVGSCWDKYPRARPQGTVQASKWAAQGKSREESRANQLCLAQ